MQEGEIYEMWEQLGYEKLLENQLLGAMLNVKEMREALAHMFRKNIWTLDFICTERLKELLTDKPGAGCSKHC